MYKIKWTDLWGKIDLHIYKTFKDFKTSSLTDIAAANMCIMKKTEVSIMYLRGDISILIPALFRKLWLYLPHRLYMTSSRTATSIFLAAQIRVKYECPSLIHN